MANRTFYPPLGHIDKGVVTLFAHVSVGASGAVTFQTWNRATRAYATAASTGGDGIKSVVRTDTGLWTVTLQDSYQRLLFAGWCGANSTGAATVVTMHVDTSGDVTSNATPTVMVVFSSVAGTAADPASGDTIDLMLVLQNSSAL